MDTWIDSYHCESRRHCDFCLAWADWHKLMDERFEMPKFGSCPYGETLAAAKERRVAVVLQRVKDRKLTAQEAIDSLEALGIDVDLEVTEE